MIEDYNYIILFYLVVSFIKIFLINIILIYKKVLLLFLMIILYYKIDMIYM